MIPLALLFPEGGYEPFPVLSFAATVAVLAAFVLRRCRPRSGCCASAPPSTSQPACSACSCTRRSGSNIERYGVLLGAPLLLCALLRERPDGARRAGIGLLGALALAALGTWVLWGPVRETAAVDGTPATSAAYYVPVERFLERARRPPGPGRGAADALALGGGDARADGCRSRGAGRSSSTSRYDGVLLAGDLTARTATRHGCDREAVDYVALPDAQPDPSSAAEDRLIRSGLPYLQPVFASAHWRIFRVHGAQPLATGPGRLTELGHDTFACKRTAPAPSWCAMHYTRYWTCAPEMRASITAPKASRRCERGRPDASRLPRASRSPAFGSGAGAACHGSARRETEEAGVAGQVDVPAVADDRVEGAGFHFEEHAAGRDPEAVGAVVARGRRSRRSRPTIVAEPEIFPPASKCQLMLPGAGVERVEVAVVGAEVDRRSEPGRVGDRRARRRRRRRSAPPSPGGRSTAS